VLSFKESCPANETNLQKYKRGNRTFVVSVQQTRIPYEIRLMHGQSEWEIIGLKQHARGDFKL
jgi:hypothetical protein